MIARLWHGRVPTAKADAYRKFVNGRAMVAGRKTAAHEIIALSGGVNAVDAYDGGVREPERYLYGKRAGSTTEVEHPLPGAYPRLLDQCAFERPFASGRRDDDVICGRKPRKAQGWDIGRRSFTALTHASTAWCTCAQSRRSTSR